MKWTFNLLEDLLAADFADLTRHAQLYSQYSELQQDTDNFNILSKNGTELFFAFLTGVILLTDTF